MAAAAVLAVAAVMQAIEIMIMVIVLACSSEHVTIKTGQMLL